MPLVAGRAQTVRAPRGVAARRLRLVDVVGGALGTYYRRFWRVVLAAVVIMTPIDLVVTLLQDFVRQPEGNSLPAWAVRVAAGAGNVVAATLGTTFFAGVLDRIVAVDQRGEQEAPLLTVLREVPVMRLILADLASVGLIVLGMVAFVIPGLVIAVLLGVVGPLIVMEDLRVWPALKRSARLVWPHMLLAFLLVFVPTALEESLVDWTESTVHGHALLFLIVDVAVTAVVGSFVGMLEITLAHGLVADQQWRLAQKDATEVTDERTAAAALGSGKGSPAPTTGLVVLREAAEPETGAPRPAAGPAAQGPTASGGGDAAG
jgi:hypothetical protein